MDSKAGEAVTGDYLRGMRAVLALIHEAEAIDARHGFALPGDSALAIALWGLESDLGELDRGRRSAVGP